MHELYLEFYVARHHASRLRVAINGVRAPTLSYDDGAVTIDPEVHHRAGYYRLHRTYRVRIALCTSKGCTTTTRHLQVKRRTPHGEGSTH